MLERKGTKMFKFIENLMADAKIRKCEKELEESDVSMDDMHQLNMAMKLWQEEGMDAVESWEQAGAMREKLSRGCGQNSGLL